MRKQFTTLLILIFVLGLTPFNFLEAITQNQINAEVQIVCPDSYGNWFSGSGTIIDPKGIILTNKHVVTDEKGGIIKTCFIGFVESINAEPNFGSGSNPNIAEVKYYTSTNDMDAAILYLDNKSNKVYPYIDIWGSDSNTLTFGDKLEVVGFPGIGGSTITYTSGDFSGFGSKSDGTQNYIKTTAPLEHGNSGGASYNLSTKFIGIPTMVVAGTLNSLSYILSINSIKNWLSGILGNNYQQEVIEQKPIIEVPKINIQNDITPPSEPSNLNAQCYTDSNKFSYIILGLHYIDFGHSSQSSVSSIYCEWTNLLDSSGIAGYYVYFGQNINARPINDGVFSAQPNFQPSFTTKGRYRFIIQAKDNAGNVSEPIDFGSYHYLMLDEDNMLINTINEKIKQNKITTFYVYDYSNGVMGDLLLTIPYEGYIQGNPYKIQSNNLYIKWDGMTDRNFVSSFKVKFASDKFETLKDNYLTNIGMTVNKTTGFTIETSYTVGMDNNIPWLNKKVFEIMPIKNKKYQPSELANRLKGKILLQVESHGEAWYVNPKDNKRYYMANGNEAYNVMRNLGVGITNNNLAKIKTDKNLAKKSSGKIFLQIEARGEAYYIDFNGVAHYLKDGAAAYTIMRELGLGIKNNDLSKILEGSL